MIAPDFELGALQQECAASHVTPMRSADLAKLLMGSAASGTVDFPSFQTLFQYHDPDHVGDWVADYVDSAQAKPHLSIAELLGVIEEIGFEGHDIQETTVIADRLRQRRGGTFPTEIHVRRVVDGPGVLLPSIVRSIQKQVYLSAAPGTIRDALLDPLNRLPEEIRMGIDKGF